MTTTYAHHRLDIDDVDIYVTASSRGWANIRRRMGGSLHPLQQPIGGRTSEAVWVPRSGAPERKYIAVYVNPHMTPGEHVDTCAHEATHVGLWIAESFGIEPHGSKGEPLSYLVGWLTAWIWTNTRQEIGA